MSEQEADLQTQRCDAEKATSPTWGIAGLRKFTPARIALRTTGESLATAEVLNFQLAHARARDAVYTELQSASLADELRSVRFKEMNSAVLHLKTQAANRRVYLQRPDLGRRLDEPSIGRLRQHREASEVSSCDDFDVAVVVVDGLSALAVERHVKPLLTALMAGLADAWPSVRLAPVTIVEQGRVAVGDEVAQTLRAKMAVVLIGERPGLSSPDSLGVYLTWNPKPSTTDAERNCISNIRGEGLSYPDAAARMVYYICEAHRLEQTGVRLKDPSEDELHSLAPVVRVNEAQDLSDA